MTNEEAVRILRRIQEPEAWEPKVNEAAFEALDMAIEALSRQQAAGSEELIGKQAAITALAFAKETGTMKCGELKGVIEVLNRLPSAEPKKGKWISLPLKRARICSCCEHDEPYKFADDDATVFNYCPYCGAKMDEVIT